jgi:hypothetical protein
MNYFIAKSCTEISHVNNPLRHIGLLKNQCQHELGLVSGTVQGWQTDKAAGLGY